MRTGLSRSSIYLWISKRKFSAPVSLGARAVTLNRCAQTDNDELVAAQNLMLAAIFGSEIGILQ
jgi:hypothetical protein